jgi:uncharacterized membrane protein HdeD (DUF308 family)
MLCPSAETRLQASKGFRGGIVNIRSRTLWRAIPAVVAGVVAVGWPSATIEAVTVLFAVYAFGSAVVYGVMGFRSTSAAGVYGWLLIATLDILVAAIALSWPGITALVLVWSIAAWAVVTGVIQIVLVFASGELPGGRVVHALDGVVALLFAVCLVVRPDVGAAVLSELLGFFLLVYAAATLVTGATAGRRFTAGSPAPAPQS